MCWPTLLYKNFFKRISFSGWLVQELLQSTKPWYTGLFFAIFSVGMGWRRDISVDKAYVLHHTPVLSRSSRQRVSIYDFTLPARVGTITFLPHEITSFFTHFLRKPDIVTGHFFKISPDNWILILLFLRCFMYLC